jgi:hypothetical protein
MCLSQMYEYIYINEEESIGKILDIKHIRSHLRYIIDKYHNFHTICNFKYFYFDYIYNDNSKEIALV